MNAVAVCLLFFAATAATACAAEITGRASVIDGDTIEIAGTRIRFDGIDAPESKQICDDAAGKPYRCGAVSAAALADFLSKSRPTTCLTSGKTYGRFVGLCFRADGQDVNRWLVLNGYAIDWPKYSHGWYAADQAEAQAERRGLWSGSFQEPCVVRRSKCN